MKLNREIMIKLFFHLLGFGLLFELSLIFLISFKSKGPLNNAIENIVELAQSKILILNEKLNMNSNSLMYKYISDLKLILVHRLQFSLGNQKSKFLSNYQYRKKIIPSDDYNYPNNENPNQYYDNETGFNYIEKLYKKFKKNHNHNEIINELFKEEEFDIIGYYNYTNNSLYKIDITKSLYCISILKSIYFKRFILRRNDTEYLRFVLTNGDFSFIYPFDRSNNSLTIQLFNQKISLLNQYDSEKCKSYTLINNQESIFFYFYFDYEYIIFCVVKYKQKIEQKFNYYPSICLEISTDKFLDNFFWKNQTELEFTIVFLKDNRIRPVYHKNSEYYNLVKETYKSEKFKQYQFVSIIKLFHVIYFNLFNTYKNLNFTSEFIDELIDEYSGIKQLLLEKINEIEGSYCIKNSNKTNYITNLTIDIKKTKCFKNPDNHKVKCEKDISKFVIYTFVLETRELHYRYYIDKGNNKALYPLFYSIYIIESNPNITRKNINNMINHKIIKLYFFFVFALISLLTLIWLSMDVINKIFLSSIYKIIDGLNSFDKLIEEKKNLDINKILKFENKILIGNQEMKVLSNISNNIKKIIILEIVMNNNDENKKYLDNSRICNIILKMQNSLIKEIYLMKIAYHHFKTKSFSLAENEFNLVLNSLTSKEKKLNINNIRKDTELKEIIKRFNDISYLNDNSNLKGINETILPCIKIKFLRQKVIYLHGMCLYKIGISNIQNKRKSIKNNINNLNSMKNFKIQNNNVKNNNYNFINAIKDFEECRNINRTLGSNPIKEIFSLIMIAKCNLELSEHKNAISSLSKALELFFEIEKIFKDTNNISYNPCIMMFTLNFVFQTIMYTMVQVTYFSYKFHACIYLIMKIMETSPFVSQKIFYNCSFIAQSIIGKTKLKKNSIIYDNTKKLFTKLFTRLYVRYYNNTTEINLIKLMYNLSASKRMSTKLELNSGISSMNKITLLESFKPKDSQNVKLSGSLVNNITTNKTINICVSEKIMSQNNGIILKDVIINYIEECFYNNNDNDKFSFVQFSYNGKKNIYIKPVNKEIFIQKLKIDKNEKNNRDNLIYNSNNLFNEFYNLLNDFIEICKNNNDDIISNNVKFNVDDNIILMFINTEDVRFNDKEDCKKIVYDLNKYNFSLYLISYEEIIEQDKIKNIKSFMTGLFDAHFFQIKNYQQIKQIFMNISTKQTKENIFEFNYENLDLFL